MRFGIDGGGGVNFIQVVSNSDVNGVIDSLMPQFAPGSSFTKLDSAIGVESAVRVTVDSSGLIYWFVAHNGQTYVLHFPESDLVIGSFRFN